MRSHPEAIGMWPDQQRFPIREYGVNVHARGSGGDGEMRGSRHGAGDHIDEQDCPNRSAWIDELLKRKRV